MIRKCFICGREIKDKRKKIYCSFECKLEARRRRARLFKHYQSYDIIGEIMKRQHGTGYIALANAIIGTAIEDIRILDKRQIRNFENPAYRARVLSRAKEGKPGRTVRALKNYMDAKEFLLGRRITGLTEHDGKEIYKLLMREKGLSNE